MGHMMVAHIAKTKMSEEDVKFFETILHVLDYDYPSMGTMETAAVWLDHIKCADGKHDGCVDSDTYDGNNVFYTSHFASQGWNPSKSRVNNINDLEYFLPTNQAIPVNHLSQAISSLATKPQSGLFSANQFIRSLLHIVGDLHQPLHTFSSICRFSNNRKTAPTPTDLQLLVVDPVPEGMLPLQSDQGGNMIVVKSETDPKSPFVNLHALWDGAGGLYTKSFPMVTVEEVEKAAEALLAEVGEEVTSGKYEALMTENMLDAIVSRQKNSKTILEKWVEASYESLSDKVFQEVEKFCTQGKNWGLDPYVPSEAYIQMVQEYSKRRIVLAGVRMGALFTQIAEQRRKILADEKSDFKGVDLTVKKAQRVIDVLNADREKVRLVDNFKLTKLEIALLCFGLLALFIVAALALSLRKSKKMILKLRHGHVNVYSGNSLTIRGDESNRPLI
eukprot:GDKJ01054466.1.p1 GENE.GDKJ01054466.1~~GDKJ01054466.1.p1  ORF type:complete len:473 (-),score=123.47 GDKJ01054466.1:546-1883(-)